MAKTRMPVNHVTLMFKRTSALKAGNYQKILWFEDYYLVVRMLIKGSLFHNIQMPLVNVRSDFEQLVRRSGIKYGLNEIYLQRIFYRIGFISLPLLIKNSIIRMTARIMPKYILKQIYKFLRRKSKF